MEVLYMSKIVSYLFETNALRICEENKPFWYTSGKIGPYYINTHFLYGSEQDAIDLLKFIDSIIVYHINQFHQLQQLYLLLLSDEVRFLCEILMLRL